MSRNGMPPDAGANGQVLHWPRRVLAADDLRRSLNGHREVVVAPETVVTPLAGEHLRANGVQVRRQDTSARPSAAAPWGYGQDRPHPLIGSAVHALRREGIRLEELPCDGAALQRRWAPAVSL